MSSSVKGSCIFELQPTMINRIKLNEQQISNFLADLQCDLLPSGFIKDIDNSIVNSPPDHIIRLCKLFFGAPEIQISIIDEQLNIEQNPQNEKFDTKISWKWESHENNKNGTILISYHRQGLSSTNTSNLLFVQGIHDIGVIMNVKSSSHPPDTLQLINIDHTYKTHPIIPPLINLKYIQFLSNEQNIILVTGYVSQCCMKNNINLGLGILKTFQSYFGCVIDSTKISKIHTESAQLIYASFSGNNNKIKELFSDSNAKQIKVLEMTRPLRIDDVILTGNRRGKIKYCNNMSKIRSLGQKKFGIELYTKLDMKDAAIKYVNISKIAGTPSQSDFQIGDRVLLTRGKYGIIKYIGNTEFCKGEAIGLQLDTWTPAGHNGTVRGKTYFEAQDGRGYFTRRNDISCKISPVDRTNIKFGMKVILSLPLSPTGVVKSIALVDMKKKKKNRCDTVMVTIELSSEFRNKYDGKHNGVRYFQTEEGHGIFIEKDEIDAVFENTVKYVINDKYYKGNTVLHIAVQSKCDMVVKELLRNGIDVNICNANGETALCNAIQRDDISVVEMLLCTFAVSSFAGVNASEDGGEWPLFAACARGYYKIVDLLLKTPNIQINKKHKDDGATALYIACKNGAIECVKLLLTNLYLIFINESTVTGHSPLFIASFYGYTEIVELLFNHSKSCGKKSFRHGVIDINQCDSKQHTPLYAAARNGHAAVVSLLIQHKADVNRAQEVGKTPLWIASCNGHKDVVKILINNRFIDINYKDLSGISALWAASANNHQEIVSLILKISGSNANLVNNFDGCTALWIAASRGYTMIVENLIHFNADLNRPDRKQGVTPLCIACQNGKQPVVDLLLAATCDVNRPTKNGIQPLMMATYYGYDNIVDALLKHGSDPFQTNKVGINSFQYAVQQGHLEIFKLLYEFSVNIKNPQDIYDCLNSGDDVNGWTVFHLACMRGHEKIVKYLVDIVNVDRMKMDNQHKTGIQYAEENKHTSIVSWLAEYSVIKITH